jgi:hypothetical protein
MATASKSQLNDDIYLYTTRQQPSQSPDGLMTISYEVESTFFGDVHFTISIDGSTNFAFDQDLSKGVKVTVPVPPSRRASSFQTTRSVARRCADGDHHVEALNGTHSREH